MAKTGKKQLRALWLQVHKWIGLTLAILIIPISLTGSALVWHDWLDAKLEPQRHAISAPPSLAAIGLCSSRARERCPRRAAVRLRFDKDGRPGRGHREQGRPKAAAPPEADQLWLDPRDAARNRPGRRPAAAWSRSCTSSTAA